MKPQYKIVFRLLLIVSILPLFTFFTEPNLHHAAAADNNVNWNELGHDSRDPLYRSPGGAVPTGTPIRLRLRAANGDLTAAQVRVWNDRIDTSTIYNMTLVASDVLLPNDATLYEFWEVTLPASAVSTVYWYRFIAIDGSATAYYEDDDARTGGWGQTFGSSPDNSWQLSIYDAGFQTPDWMKNAIVYQIFPDRFRDGNNTNNPGAGEFFYGNYDTIVRSNTINWNAAICDPRAVSGAFATCAGSYSQNFYGGDLQGIIDELDYLQSLGITAIYLNPIFESPSNHKYDTKDFMLIDDNFGDLTLFQTLITQAHARGINVILDGVFNHSSSDSVYFDRYSRWDSSGNPTTVGVDDDSGACESLVSSYTPWYTFFPYTGAPPSPCSDNRDYPKWFGIFDSLPVFQHDYAAVRDYFIDNGTASVGPYWMQWADGWRLDVAPEVDHGTLSDPSDDYWEDFRAAVHAVNPDAYIVGEEWGNPTSWILDDQWDATMNYQFGAAILSFWRDSNFSDNDFNGGSSAGPLNPINPGTLNERLLNLAERYPEEAFLVMMNLIGSHDTNRALFLLDHNASANNTALYANPNYDWSDAIQRLRGVTLLQMTMPGAPTIYYGNEIGLIGPVSYDGSQWQDDPYNRQPYPWLDESGTPYYTFLQSAAPGSTRADLLAYYQTLTAARNSNPALRTGTFDPLLIDDGNGVYAYGRKTPDDSNAAVVIANPTTTAQSVTVDLSGYLPAGAVFTDVLNGGTVTASGTATITVSVPAYDGALLTLGAFTNRPGTVTDLAATAGSGSVDLTWSATVNATSYDVYRSQLSGGGYIFLGNTTATTYNDATVANSVEYFYVVVAKNDTTLLESEFSNEASAIPALAIGWHTLQWPPTITHTLSAVTPTENIYGQIWIGGVTDAPGQAAGILADVGYGPEDVHPSDPAWTWFTMTFNTDVGNNDEYVGNLLPDAVGSYDYTVRWSTDGGVNWTYSQLNPPGGDYDVNNVGLLTVNAPADTTPPAAPTNLTLVSTTATSVSLGWDAHPNTDGDLYGFNVYRENTAAPGYAIIDTIVDPLAVSYTDSTVTTGENYNYYLTALDDSLNESAASNVVNATAENLLVDVTFTVTVPPESPGTVYIVGGFNGWNPGDPTYAMTETVPGTWEITWQILDGTALEYKYARGDWERVEKQADGNAEVANRPLTVTYGAGGTQQVNDTVANWRDPLLTAMTPANGATNVPANAVITATWNQEMPATLGGTFSVTGPSGAASGTLSYDAGTTTHTFTPDANLEAGTHTVTVSGNTDVNGDVQQVPYTWTFDVVTTPTSIGWHALQWPPTITYTLSAVTPTSDVYAQIWIGGFTDAQNTPVVGITAEVGYGPEDVHPSDASWTWFPMVPNPGYDFSQNNDEYMGTMLPDAVGTYDYTVRWSLDGGTTWTYSQLNPPGGDYDVNNVGLLTVNAATDTTPPAAPTTLAVTGTTSTSISLGWDVHPNTDGDLYGFNVYRQNTAAPGFTLIDTVVGASAVAYADSTVTTGENYDYYITALDDSLNESAASNTVNATAAGTMTTIDVTFAVSVPSHTPGTVYVAGNFDNFSGSPYPNWNASGIALSETVPGQWEVTLTIPEGTALEYKYTRGSWETVEKESDGNADILSGANRSLIVADAGGGTQTVNDTVANWRDPYIIATNPADGASNVALNTSITATWNQAMPAALSSFIVTGPSGAVSGALSYDVGTDTHTFTPDTVLEAGGTYTVDIAGNSDVAGDPQQVAASWSFTTLPPMLIGWHALQWPPTLTHTISATTPTGDVYGQIWISGYTDAQNTPVPGILADVGYGPEDVHPSDPAWTWFAMTPNGGFDFSQNNDEYMGNMLPTAPGTYDYTVRWSVDGGATWTYSQLNPPGGDYDVNNVGLLTVNAAADTTAPDVPTTLVVTDATPTYIDLGWDLHPNTDGDLYGFNIYRENTAAPGYTLIDTVVDPVAVSYSDTTVVSGANYNYYVTAVDTALNESAQSNVVNATAELDSVDVTFTATVPDHTPGTVYVAGNFGDATGGTLPNWDASGLALTETTPGVWETTLHLPTGSALEYKYTRGSWETVEKEADGNADILSGSNRPLTVVDDGSGTLTVTDTVANWRDPYLVAYAPADGAADVGTNSTLTITWNQEMPVAPADFTVTGPSGLVSGTISYDAATATHIFTPDVALEPGLHAVSISGNTDVNGDVQQIPASWSFTVGTGADDTPPTAPTGLTASRGSIILHWNQHPNANGDLAGFTIWRFQPGMSDFEQIALLRDPLATEYIDTNIEIGIPYTYYLIAFDTSGNNSAESERVTFADMGTNDPGTDPGDNPGSGSDPASTTSDITITTPLEPTELPSTGYAQPEPEPTTMYSWLIWMALIGGISLVVMRWAFMRLHRR